MVKTHNCLIKITNNSGMDMQFCRDWFDSGRVADGFDWPPVIKNGSRSDILCYEKDMSLAGCSGYVTYEMGPKEVTIGFSNPVVGYNKLGVGTSGSTVWDEMTDHDYKNFSVFLTVSGVDLVFHCKCTGDTTNTCTVEIERAA